MNFSIEGEYIELLALLKATGIAETGGQAKQMVDEGLVRLNGAVESRKRAKLRVGDCVEVGDVKIVMQ
ncbi:MAG: RNA-binding S4 domain-containing protein [Bacteroidia bacterium]